MITDKLIEKVLKCRNHTVVGLDPKVDFLPDYLKSSISLNDSRAVADAFYEFNKQLIDHIIDIVPAVKPQVAFYEAYGTAGFECFAKTCRYAEEKGLVVIGDVKRGDIGTTAEAYSECYLGGKEYSINTDYITVNPYLGTDSLNPYIKDCEANSKGIFILVKTSNKSSGELQDLVCGGKTIYEHVADLVVRLGDPYKGKHGYSFIGAVVGATYREEGAKLRKIMKDNYFLVPGYGAQGGTASDVVDCFNEDGLGAIVNSSRGIIAAHKTAAMKDKYKDTEFALAAREAAIAMQNDINGELEKSNKIAW